MLDVTYPPVIAAAKTWFRLQGMKFQMSGVEHIPKKGGALIASNHIGYIDFVFNGLPAAKRGRLVRFMAKKEAFEGPVGHFMRSLHHIPVDRAAGEASLNNAVDFLRRGELVGIFPEATISRSFEVKEFKTGAVRIAAEAGVPLIPMALWGTQLLKTKDHPSDLWGRGKTISIAVGPPIDVTGEDPVAETAVLRSAVADLLEKTIADYPLASEGQWWAPKRLGGLAPTPAEAKQMDVEEYAARAAKKAAKGQ
ncbi:MAG TPA: lysophospholipid acyltransferase family protein [Aeromicrobium sp.]|nr:lysophospholipid acyltransferase family protein [Aeromicrobium sp.]